MCLRMGMGGGWHERREMSCEIRNCKKEAKRTWILWMDGFYKIKNGKEKRNRQYYKVCKDCYGNLKKNHITINL